MQLNLKDNPFARYPKEFWEPWIGKQTNAQVEFYLYTCHTHDTDKKEYFVCFEEEQVRFVGMVAQVLILEIDETDCKGTTTTTYCIPIEEILQVTWTGRYADLLEPIKYTSPRPKTEEELEA